MCEEIRRRVMAKKSQGWKLMFMLRGERETYKCENNKFINIELCEL